MKALNRFLDIWEKSVAVSAHNTKLKERALALEERQFEYVLAEAKQQEEKGDPAERMVAALQTLGKKVQ